MNKNSIILKTVSGIMCLVSIWSIINFIPLPNPASNVNNVLLIVVLTLLFTGLGLIISAIIED